MVERGITPEQRAFAEKMGALFDMVGLARRSGRVLGWLLVCDPPERTARHVMDSLELSAGAVSTSLRDLERLGYVESRGEPGSRRRYFRARADAWTVGLAERTRAFETFAKIAEGALEHVRPLTKEARARLEDIRDFYAFLQERFPKLVAEWERSRIHKS